MILQIFYYVGAPIANTALGIANSVFEERGVAVEPIRDFNISEEPESLLERGRAKRLEVLGDISAGSDHPVDQDWDRYLLEYLWGSVWTRPGLDTVEPHGVYPVGAAAGGHQPVAARPHPGRPKNRHDGRADQRDFLPPYFLHGGVNRPACQGDCPGDLCQGTNLNLKTAIRRRRENMPREYFKGTAEEDRAYSPAIKVTGGTTVYLAGVGATTDANGKSLERRF